MLTYKVNWIIFSHFKIVFTICLIIILFKTKMLNVLISLPVFDFINLNFDFSLSFISFLLFNVILPCHFVNIKASERDNLRYILKCLILNNVNFVIWYMSAYGYHDMYRPLINNYVNSNQKNELKNEFYYFKYILRVLLIYNICIYVCNT